MEKDRFVAMFGLKNRKIVLQSYPGYLFPSKTK
jgi:hypothetical protein